MSGMEEETGSVLTGYDIQGIMQALREKEELDPDSHDGSYEMMRETIWAYAHLKELTAIDYRDLNLVYLTSVGTFKHGIEAKKRIIDESHLRSEDKEYLKSLWDEVWKRAGEGKYRTNEQESYSTPIVGMFGTGFFSFQNKTTANHARDFIRMCTDILSMNDDEEMYARAEQVLTKSFKGMQSASASMILHCLKPFSFPILNSNMGFKSIFEILGIVLDKYGYLETYIGNCRRIKAFRDNNFTWKNYRIFDLAAHKADQYAITTKTKAIETLERSEEKRIETAVNERVREEFMRQITQKKVELDKINEQMVKLQKEIELLEEMFKKL